MKNYFKLSVLGSLAKGFSIFYFVLLPVFYSENIIDSKKLGYIGAVFIVMLILGALVVAKWLHNLETGFLIRFSAWLAILPTITLLIASIQQSILLITLSYALMGFISGIVISGINVLIANNTLPGERFKPIARLSMMADAVRIVFPLLVAIALVIANINLAIGLILLANVIFLIFAYLIKDSTPRAHEEHMISKELKSIRSNRAFKFVLALEFLDSFSSSQLFVFIPLVFLAKGYTLQNTLLLQTFIFLGYMVGRWVVSVFASRYSGFKAVATAEIGMIVSIILLLNIKGILLLYILSFSLGVFTRGTSPALKALSFDNLKQHQIKQGSALHVLVGDSGSALAQLLFGFFVAWYGVNSPFIAAIFVGLLIAIACLAKSSRTNLA